MGLHRGIIALSLAWLATVTPTMSARGDRIFLKGNQVVEGEVTGEDKDSLTVDVTVPGMTIVRRIKKTSIRSWNRPLREGPSYVAVPVLGTIGEDVTADSIGAAFDEATKVKPRYVVLVIDSPGGDVAELYRITELLMKRATDFEIVAYVKRAYSCAAVIALTCHEIYMTPKAPIGAVVPFRVTEHGPADVDAKFRSAFDAMIRASNQHGGHADLVMRAMSELELEVFLRYEKGQPKLRTSGPGKLIKAKGQILTLTAEEATECGIARIAKDGADLGRQLARGPWYEATRRPWNAAAAVTTAKRMRKEAQQRQMFRHAMLTQIAPELASIQRRATELAAKGLAAKSALDSLKATYDHEANQIQQEYQESVGFAYSRTDTNAWLLHAAEVRNGRLAAARDAYNTASAPLVADVEAVRLETASLKARYDALLATVPSEE